MAHTNPKPASAEVINLADHRKAPTSEPAIISDIPERTPELAFILAILEALPTETRCAVRASVLRLAERQPDCEAAQRAANLVAMFAVQGA